jgi:hypothetical protein
MISEQMRRYGKAILLGLAVQLTNQQLVEGAGSFGDNEPWERSPFEIKSSLPTVSSSRSQDSEDASRAVRQQEQRYHEADASRGVEYTYPPYEKSFSLPPIPNRRRRSVSESPRGSVVTKGVINRIGLMPVNMAGYQELEDTPATQISPYDEVFLDSPAGSIQEASPEEPEAIARPVDPKEMLLSDDDDLLTSPTNQIVSPTPSPSDRGAVRENAEIEEFSNRVRDLLESERQSVTPYQPPSLKSPSEKIVPLPVVPAPADFPGYFPTNPDANTLPEPKRTFALPVPPPQTQQAPVPSQPYNRDEASSSLPGHSSNSYSSNSYSSDSYTEYDTHTPIDSRGRGHVSYDMAGYQRQPVEQYSKRAPLSTLPERLHSRHYHFKILPYMPSSSSPLPLMSDSACQVELQHSDFAPNPQVPKPLDACNEIETYYGKSMVETQRPWVEWWRPFYTGGMYEPGVPVFSDVNLLTPSFLVYGDYRTAVGIHRFGGQPTRQWAHRLNLDMDLRLTGTERFHMFTGPLDDNGRFTRLDFSDSNNVEFEEELDFRPDTAFFEGDLGAITGSWTGTDAPFDLPFTMGIVPLLYQNGIWMEDAIVGFAFGSPWRHSRLFNWENFETTFFAGFADINSPAFQDQNAAKVFGTAWFIEAYGGYIEADYAYLDERQDLGRSYHNAAIAYTRRYLGRISNSIRLIGNAGQRGPAIDRTADGGLLLVENSLITSQPSHFVPYFNGFVGNGRPQSVARAGGSGEILRNTGINFESDGLTAYPTLNATGANSYGGAIGFNLLSADFRQQFVAEFTALDRYGNPAISRIAGPQYAIGARYQRTLNNRSLIRFDAINGWLDNASNIYGMRSEFRWKF